MKSRYLVIVFSIISFVYPLYSYIDDDQGLSDEDIWVMGTFSEMTLD